jgi:hypothetical protein
MGNGSSLNKEMVYKAYLKIKKFRETLPTEALKTPVTPEFSYDNMIRVAKEVYYLDPRDQEAYQNAVELGFWILSYISTIDWGIKNGKLK